MKTPSRSSLHDQFGRKINYIRISITDRCNYRCVYCMPVEGIETVSHEEVLSFEEILHFCQLAVQKGINRFKITGGEPLCRLGATDFIKSLKNIPGVEQVTLTTNGAYLLRDAQKLVEAGLDAVTISLDTLDPEHYTRLTRTAMPLDKVLEGIEIINKLGMPVKINTVPMQGYNDEDLLDLTDYAIKNHYHIRFIELMPVGIAHKYDAPSPENIRERIEKKYGELKPIRKKMGNGPAEYFSLADGTGAIGFISALSHKFCSTCNRIRLTSTGFLKTCLYHNVGLDLGPLLKARARDDEILQLLQKAIYEKPRAHNFETNTDTGSDGFMSSVGG